MAEVQKPEVEQQQRKEYRSPRLTDLGGGEAAAEEVRRKAEEQGLGEDEVERLLRELRLRKPQYLAGGG